MPNEKNIHIDHDLIARYLAHETTSEEEGKVRLWILASPKNQEEFDKLAVLWSTSSKVSERETVTSKNWEKLQGRIQQDQEKASSHYPWYYKVAAILILGVLLGGYYFSLTEEQESTYISANESIVEDTLTDGSIIALNTHSELVYMENDKENLREVQLKGEAFFDVQRDSLRPFIIKTGNTTVEVLGTSFNIKEGENHIEVTVESGTVAFSIIGQSDNVILKKGDKGVYTLKDNKIKKLKSTEGYEMYWKSKVLIFRKTTLDIVVRTLSSLFHKDVQLASDSLGQCKLTTTFKDQSLVDILDIISSTFDIKVKRENQKIVLEGDGCL